MVAKVASSNCTCTNSNPSKNVGFLSAFKLSSPPRVFQKFDRQRYDSSTSSTCTNYSSNSKKPSTARSIPAGRRVRFEMNSLNRVKTHVHTYDVPDDTDFHEVYYSIEEMARMKRDVTTEATLFATRHPNYVDSLECLFDSPLKTRTSHGPPLTPEDAATNLQKNYALVETPRGLEINMSLLRKRHRKWAVSNIIHCYAALFLQGSGATSSTGDNPEEFFLALCERVNNGSRKFALQLAQLDEMEARESLQ
jgi:hypothetical protein